MTQTPTQPKIYHITHVNNLTSIVNDGELLSDAQMIRRGGPSATIGMTKIKRRRLALPVKCHPGTFVGDYVPFYFCYRSVMLYVISKGNNPELQFKGGQDEIVHLEVDYHSAVTWANRVHRLWAYSLSNAGAVYTEFDSGLPGLGRLDWAAIANTDFRDSDVKESKQAEFLMHTSLPWSLVSGIGVSSVHIQTAASTAISLASHKPPIAVMRNWYY